jgi:hypothetical protein
MTSVAKTAVVSLSGARMTLRASPTPAAVTTCLSVMSLPTTCGDSM